MSLNPDIAAFLQLVGNGRASGKRVGMHELTPSEAREQFDQSSLLMDAGGEELAVVDELQLPVRDGALLNARIYSNHPLQAGAGRPALLYFHGGGYVVDSLDSHDSLCRALAALADCVVLSVAYRLAPEHRFPTAADDARDAWDWLVASAADLGIDAAPLEKQLLMEVKGRHALEGVPRTVTVNDSQIREALAEPLRQIVQAVRDSLERIPPELSADIYDRGVVLTGGGALLRNLDKRLRDETGLPVLVAENPLTSVVMGAGMMLTDLPLLRKVAWE